MPNDTAAPRVFQKGYLPAEVTRHNSNVAEDVNLLRFPLGDADNFSVARAAYALGQQKAGRYDAWARYAPWEKAYLEAIREVQFKAQGEMVSGIDGGYLAPEAWSDRFFGLLRSFSAIDRLPVTKFNVPARVLKIPKVMGDISVLTPGENNSITASQFNFGQLSYTAHKSTALINASNELMRDAPELVDQVLRFEGAQAIALDRDTQLLTGTGSLGPTGLIQMATNGTISKYYPGASASAAIQTAANHATPSFNHISQLKGKIHALNNSTAVTAGQARCTGMIAHTRFEQTVMILAAAAGAWTDAQGRPLWMTDLNAQGGLAGTEWALTNILPITSTDGGGTASSFIIGGWWQQYVLFECLTLGFDATTEGQGFASDQTQIRLVHRYDGGPVHPEAFAVLAGCDA